MIVRRSRLCGPAPTTRQTTVNWHCTAIPIDPQFASQWNCRSFFKPQTFSVAAGKTPWTPYTAVSSHREISLKFLEIYFSGGKPGLTVIVCGRLVDISHKMSGPEWWIQCWRGDCLVPVSHISHPTVAQSLIHHRPRTSPVNWDHK